MDTTISEAWLIPDAERADDRERAPKRRWIWAPSSMRTPPPSIGRSWPIRAVARISPRTPWRRPSPEPQLNRQQELRDSVAWLYRVAFDAANDELRREKRAGSVAAEPIEAVAPPDVSELIEALRTLPLRERAAVVLSTSWTSRSPTSPSGWAWPRRRFACIS